MLANRCASLVGFMVSIFAADSASADSLEKTLSPLAKKSIVYVEASYVDQTDGAVRPFVGTGFIISEGGYVLTAYHVVREWLKQSTADKKTHQMFGSIGGKYTISKYPLEIVNHDEKVDVALLKLQFSDDIKLSPAPLCLDYRPASGDRFVAFGFPLESDFQPTPGTIGSTTGEHGTWTASSDFTYGMSGGPVFNADGIIGLAKGGQKGEPALRWVIPIRHAQRLISLSDEAPRACTIKAATQEAVSSAATLNSFARTCLFQIGPKKDRREIFPISAPSMVGQPCQDGVGSMGQVVPDDSKALTRYTSTCEFLMGPKAGQTGSFPAAPKFLVEQMCWDGINSYGLGIPE